VLILVLKSTTIQMKENKLDITENPFFTRGCCAVPKPGQPGESYRSGCAKLSSYNWLKDIEQPDVTKVVDIVEVRFKNSKKDFFKVPPDVKLLEGDIVAVEASPGHDLGIVTLYGETARLQMKVKGQVIDPDQMKKVYRRARASDIEKWISAVEKEERTKRDTRKIVDDLNLDMKINDVEYQGDNTKAIFYYTASERVDFRELIKVLADMFRIRIEMKQIGARQEAARLGGIGSCGRELCCATWRTNFTSVSTNNARLQQLSLNPTKLAGQCGKLKCCLNFENDFYKEAMLEFPSPSIRLKTKKGDAVYQKADVFNKLIWYSYYGDNSSMMAIPLNKVMDIIKKNKAGKLPEQLEDYAQTQGAQTEYKNGEEELDMWKLDDSF